MSFIQLIRAFLFIFLVTILSCNKGNEELSKPEVIPAPTARSESNLVRRQKTDIGKDNVVPIWKDAIYFDNFVEVPFELEGKVPRPKSPETGVGQGRERLIIQRRSKESTMYVVTYVPAKKYKGNINAVNSRNFKIIKFDGTITLRKIGTNTFSVLQIKNGNIVRRSKFKRDVSPRSANARECVSWEQDTDWYSCSGGECTYMYTTTETGQDCDGGGDNGNGDGGSGGYGDCGSDPICGVVGGDQPNGPSDDNLNRITNNLSTPCLKDVMSKIRNANFNANVQNIFQRFNASPILDFTIQERNLNDDDLNAQTVGNVITLNNVALANASQEFIAKVIYHEVLHVYLGGGVNSDHQTMASNYVNPLTQTLTSLFPNLSYTDAQALSWSGLKETNSWDAFGQAGKDQIFAIATRHKNLNNSYDHQHGTSCN